MSKSRASEFQSSAGAVMIRVPAGSFTMGSPQSEDGHRPWEQERQVTFASDFYLGKTPVTQDQYVAVTGTNPTRHARIGEAPVDSADWHAATQYCQRLTQLDRQAGVLPDDFEYRLPTEAEWEYACRSGNSAPRHGQPLEVAWFCGNADGHPHAVGQLSPNPWGFHDMLGNVWEWCQDWYWGYNTSYRCLRGGSYFSSSRYCRASQRWGLHPESRSRHVGFRLLAASRGRSRPLKPSSGLKPSSWLKPSRRDSGIKVLDTRTSSSLSPPIDDFPKQYDIYEAIRANDFEWALRIVTADPDAVECPEGIPPPLEHCGDEDKPEWTEWLLDHGADIERLNQDYGSTALACAVIRRQKRAIRTLVKRGADASRAMRDAQRGLAGDFEDEVTDLAKPEEAGDVYDPATQRYIRRLDREGYREIVELLRELGIEK